MPGFPHYQPLAHDEPAAGLLPNYLSEVFVAESGHVHNYGLNNDAGLPFAMEMHVLGWMFAHRTNKLAHSLPVTGDVVPQQPLQPPTYGGLTKEAWNQVSISMMPY